MKTNSYFFKNFLVFLFFIFTSITFAQGTTCGTSETLTINGTCDAASITDATQNTPNATGCSIGAFRREGWYTFTVPAGPNLSITITASASNRDLFLQLISSTSACTDLAQINCANANTTAGAQTETITATLSPGIYYVKLINNGNNNNMNLTSICITSPCTGTPSAGTTSVSPTSGAAGSSYTVSNTGHATGSGITYQWQYSTNGGGTWTNQGAATSTYANYTATAPASGTVIWRLAVRCNASGQTSYSTTATFTVLAGMTNDNCSGAIPLTINTSCSYTNYTNVGATASSGVPAPGCASYSGGDVWFSFVVPANGTVTVDTQTGSITDSGMAWYTGTCGSLTLLECDDDDSANGTMSSITRTGLTPGTTIYVRFWDYNDGFGSFGICATSPGPCTTPGSQATGFTAGTITSNSFPATFSGTANGYLVIRSTSATPPSPPVNGVIYTGANIATLGTGLTLVQNGTSTTIPGTGLTGNTRYYYYIYAYNNSGCSGGPLYNASGPLTGTAVTCPAAPSPVTTASTLTSVAFSWPSSLGGGANGVSYELQVTTDAGYTLNVGTSPFTINNPTTTFNLTGLTANTTYYYRIRAGNGCWSTYTTGTATTGYCAPAPTSVDGTGIINVTLGTINNTTGAEAGNYGNYSAMSTSGTLGQTIPFSIRFSTDGFSYETIIWIDWNNDLDFNDPGEVVFTGTSAATDPATLTGSFQIPGSATIGNHRIRIGGLDSGTPTPCYTGSYGTYEDYTLTVTAPPACSGTPSAGTVTTTPNTGWPGSPYTVIATGYSIASNLTFQWQYSTDAGATWTNAGTATSTYSNYNATAPAIGIVHWRLVVTCTNSSQTATSTTGIFTTVAVSNVVTGCPNVVSGGLGLNGADPAPFDCTATATCVDLEATYLDLGNTTNYIVEPIAYNPPFAFNGLANPISVNTDDVWSPIIKLPFDFCFYGNTFTECLVGSNGVLTFDTTNNTAGGTCGWSMYGSGTGANLPVSGHGALIENAIFGVFHDINPSVSGQVGWELITLPSGCRALVVAWNNVAMYSSDTTNDYTGMIVLYENSNVIEVYVQKKRITSYQGFAYEDDIMWNDGNAVIGIQNANGTQASVPPGRNVLDPNWSATNEAWRFVPNGTSIASIAWYEGPTASGPVLGTNDILNVCPTATTTYTAEITYTLCDGRTIKETDTTTVTVNGAKTWNGSVNTDWNVANNWTPVGVPTAMDCVVIADTANDPIISGTNYNGLGLNLTVNNNATLTVTTNNDLTITDWVNINTTGDLVLQNSASLIQVNNTPNQGTMHMTRTANIRKLDYVYWSSPVSSFASSAISPGTPTSYIYKWTPTIPTNTNFFGNWASGNEIMALGKGYIVRGPDSFTSTVASFNTIFTGTPNNGIITTPIARGTWNGGTYSTGVSTTLGTNDDDNWNLIGNPYPSAVRAIDFLTLNTNIDGFIKIWTHGTLPSTAIADPFYNNYVYNYTPGDYITYNSSGASAGPGTFGGYIGAGQGFFVLMNHTSASTSENVTFNNTMRSSTYDNQQFYRTTNDNNGRIWLDLIGSNGSNVRNLVAYADGATNNRDRLFDAITDEKLNLNLYSAIGETPMTIQGRTLPFDQNDRVPMGVKIPQDGNYSIAIGVVDGFFTDANQEIYLEDKATNVIHNLRDAPYNFTSVAGNHANRFILRYTNETLGNDDVISDEANLWVISSDILSVKSTKNTIQSVRVFDVLGRHLAYYPNVDGYEVPLTTIQKNNAGLVIQVTLSNGTVISKKAIY